MGSRGFRDDGNRTKPDTSFEWRGPSVRWAWSLNAASSVLGSVGALVAAIYMGLVQTIILGGLFYLAALAVIARGGTREAPAPEPGPGRVVLAK